MTTAEFDPLARSPLARRLARMVIPVPPLPHPGAVGHRAPAARRRMVRRTVGGLAAATATILVATAAAFPGGIPGLTRAVLGAAGLSSGQVSALHGTASRGPLKVVVGGGYADEVSTVVFAAFDQSCRPSRSCGWGGPYLTDQFGDRYDMTGGWGIGVGVYPIFFEPLSGPAAASGARLTLHVPVETPAGRSLLEIALSGTLAPQTARSLPLPAPITDSSKQVAYAVLGLRYSGTYLEVHTRLSGDLGHVIVRESGGGGWGETWPGVFVVDPSGRYQIPLATAGPGRAVVNQQVEDETRVFAVSEPGTYELVVSSSPGHNATPGRLGSTVLAEWTVAIPARR
ncbi:MAG: hypothetical protein ACREPI_05200 [Candidatus Dormibacterales bacterium]